MKLGNIKRCLKRYLGKKIHRLLESAQESIKHEKHFDIKQGLKFCGTGVVFRGEIKITFGHNVEIHDNVYINENCFLNGRGGITIGENTQISRGFTVYSSDHNHQGNLLPYDHSHLLKPVSIGRNVWIGTNVVIVPGSKIGDGAIIGAGTVVSGEVPELAIICGPKFRILKYRDQEDYHQLNNSGAYFRRPSHHANCYEHRFRAGSLAMD